ncbi:MAG: family 16 glycosylhydrolase [Oscillospiraceae bacterium]|nr:family 16 glycosylhydrolase [Oscillospiraceae bacterium]
MKLFAALTAAVFCLTALPVSVSAEPADVFSDDFSGTRLDPDKWLIAEKNWGGTVTENGKTADYNGGVIAENVSVANGRLILTGHGNRYDGTVRGINRDGTRRADGKRCGAAIATKEYFGSGSYEIRAKIAPELGCCSAMWTFEYEESYAGDALTVTNHEIDIEFPGRDENDAFSLSHALCTTWVTEQDYKTKSVACGAQADGQFHTYRFDWHTGSDTEKPRVDYYFDGVLTHTAETYIPTNAGRFWLGLWFPKGWAGTPDFDTAVFEIDRVKITPFHEPGDTPQHETYADSGWAQPGTALPEGWLLWHSYSDYAARDSRLFLRSPDGETQEITGDFVHAMNGSFGRTPEQIVFMAIDEAADEWDIFRYDGGRITNLTPNSGFRNEDPRFSPDGTQIVFKRGRWDSTADDFVYDLALLDPDSGAVTMLTDDPAEQAMPCFSPDGRYLYYAEYQNGIGRICRMALQTRKTDTVYSENGVTAYYPVASGDRLYFTKWYSAENRCDQIMQYDGTEVTAMPFDSADYDCSDACPVPGGMICSSTKNGSYDLYYFDGAQSVPLTEINTPQNELGASLFAAVRGDLNADGECTAADAVMLQKWLLCIPETVLPAPSAGDLNKDGILDAADLTLLKRLL